MQLRALLLGLTAAGLACGSASAFDVWQPNPATAYNPAAFNFDGFYLGAQGGGVIGGFSAGSIGVVAGSNFTITDPVVAGLEFQANALFGGPTTDYDFFVLGRLGVVVTPDLLAYGEIGPGWRAGTGGYAIGGGGEYALTDMLSVKGEVQGFGAWGAGPSNTKVQAGLVFHLP